MCGSNSSQTELEQSQADFYTQLKSQDATIYGEDQGILQQMHSVYDPILAAGPNQYGFSQGETSTLDSQSTENVAKGYAGADKALKETQAAEGGGNSYLPSGVQSQQQEELNSSAAAQHASDLLSVKQSGYSQGYSQFEHATAALQGSAAVAAGSTGSADAATSGGSAASKTASDIAMQDNSWVSGLEGAAGAVGAAAVKAYAP